MKLLIFLGLCLAVTALRPGSDKIPPVRHQEDENVAKTFGRVKRGVEIPPVIPEEGDKINGQMADHLDGLGKAMQDRDDVPLPGKHMIGKNRHPKTGDKPMTEEGEDVLPLLMKTHRLRPGSEDYKRIVEKFINDNKDELVKNGLDLKADNIDLPLLMKTLRLRPGSKVYNEIVEKYINSQMLDKPVSDDTDDVPLPGENMLGSNRRPRGADNGDDLPLLMKTLRLRPGSEDYNRIVNDFINKNKGDMSKRGLDGKQDVDLPLLMRTLRLRPGSKVYNEIVEKYLNSLKGDDNKVDDLPLPGENMLGSNRLPRGDDADLPLLMKTLRLRPGSKVYKEILEKYMRSQMGNNGDDMVKRDLSDLDLSDRYDRISGANDGIGKREAGDEELDRDERGGNKKKPKVSCMEDDRKQVLKCFSGFLKNFGLEVVDGKLPTALEMYMKMMPYENRYEELQGFFKNFKGCYKSTPESCYHSNQLEYLVRNPAEADYVAAYFGFSEFMFVSEHNKELAECFGQQAMLESFSTGGMSFNDCKQAKDVMIKSIAAFKDKCQKVNAKEGELKRLLKPYVWRTSLGKNCPKLWKELDL